MSWVKEQVTKIEKVLKAKSEMVRRNITHATVHCPCGGKNTLKVVLVKSGNKHHSRFRCDACGFVGME